MSTRTGNLSINSENMLPIIKKWLYSDHDIFAREVVSNACDAITKLHKLSMLSEYEYPEDHKDSIQVIVDPDAKTLTFSDTGLGMTEEEVEETTDRLSALTTYVRENTYKFITGERSLDEFDDYVNTLYDTYELDEVIAIRQAQVDRVLSR